MSILVSLLIVLGLLLLTWGGFSLMWGTRRHRIVGSVLLIAAAARLSMGVLGFIVPIR